MAQSLVFDGASRRILAAAALFAAAPVVLAAAAMPAQPAGSTKASVAEALPTYAAGVADDVTPAPTVTSPSESVARFSIGELPLIASVVHVRCVGVVLIARIGGLYGPQRRTLRSLGFAAGAAALSRYALNPISILWSLSSDGSL